MSDLVKTGNDIQVFLNLSIRYDGLENKEYDEESSKKYLVLPQGLDKLEEMLKKELCNEFDNTIEDVFARFKKENMIDLYKFRTWMIK